MRADGVVRLSCPGRVGIHTAFLRDLSRGGMFVHVVDPEPVGRQLEFALSLPGHRAALRGVAEVVWVRTTYAAPGQAPGMALRFVALEPATIETLGRSLPPGDEPDVALLPPPRVFVPTRTEAPEVEPLPVVAPALELEPPLELEPAAIDASPEPEADPVRFAPPPPTVAIPVAPARAPRASARWHGAAAGIAGIAGLAALAIVGAARWGGSHPDSGWVEVPTASPAAARAQAPGAPMAAPVNVAPAAIPVLPTSPPARRLTRLHWETPPGGGTLLVATFDGDLAPERVSASRIGGDSPRLVVIVHEIPAAPIDGWQPATQELARVRPGHHDGAGGGDLHLVLDLTAPGVTVERDVAGAELRLRLTAPVGSASRKP